MSAQGIWDTRYEGGPCYAACMQTFTFYNPSINHCWKGCDYGTGRVNQPEGRQQARKMCKLYTSEVMVTRVGQIEIKCFQPHLPIYIGLVLRELEDKDIDQYFKQLIKLDFIYSGLLYALVSKIYFYCREYQSYVSLVRVQYEILMYFYEKASSGDQELYLFLQYIYLISIYSI